MTKKNEYAHMLGQGVYDDTPKEVWAAIAVSYMSIGGDWPELAGVNLALEWEKLRMAQVVSQPIPLSVRTVAVLARNRLIECGNGAMLNEVVS